MGPDPPEGRLVAARSLPEDVAIVEVALRVLKTRDGIDISSELIEERSRNIIAALDIAPAATLADAAGAVAALLADPLDPDARAVARAWLREVKSTSSRRAA